MDAFRDEFYEEFKKNDAVLSRVSKIVRPEGRVNKKVAPMKTPQAIQSGKTVEDALAKFKRRSMLKKDLEELIKVQPFKGISPFLRFFGFKWDMIARIVIDPAHEFHNLVKDLLALMNCVSSMQFKPKRLAEEKLMGRFTSLANNRQAPWIIRPRLRKILSALLKSGKLKLPSAWAKLLNYFNDDYEKMKIAESLAL